MALIYSFDPYANVRKTRFDGLGMLNWGAGNWRFVDMTTPSSPAVVGPQYQTKAELLADMDRYAKEAGWTA